LQAGRKVMGVGAVTVNRAWLSKSEIIPKHGQVALLQKSSRTRKPVPPSSEQKNTTFKHLKKFLFSTSQNTYQHQSQHSYISQVVKNFNNPKYLHQQVVIIMGDLHQNSA
jgi:hypothetical protein